MRNNNGEILLSLNDWKAAGLSYSQYKMDRYRGKLKATRATRNRPVQIYFDSIQDEAKKQKIIAALGDPSAIRSHLSEKQIKILTGNFTSIGRACGCSQGYVVRVLKGEVNYSGPKARAIRKKAGLLLELLTP